MKLLLNFLNLLILYSFFPTSFATTWPSFHLPTPDFLKTSHLFSSQNCPDNKVKAVHLSTLAFSSFCQNYCPKEWTWVMVSKQDCFDPASLKLSNYEIMHIHDPDGTTNYSVVTATYGNDAVPSLFSLVFTTPVNEHWFCVGENNQLTVCANDI